MRRTIQVGIGLALVYLLTLASVKPLDLAAGLLVGAVLARSVGWRFRLEHESDEPSFPARLLWFPVFAAGTLAEVAQGTWDVLLRIVHVRAVDRPGIVRVPIGERSQRGVAVSALTTTLSPGSVLVDVDWEAGDLLLHVIDASDPDGVRARLQRFYDRYQRRVFP